MVAARKTAWKALILSALVQTAHGAAASKIKDLDNHDIAQESCRCRGRLCRSGGEQGQMPRWCDWCGECEIVGEKLLGGRDLSKPACCRARAAEEAKIIAYSRLVLAGTAAGSTGGDANMAADAAKVAVENNTLREELILEAHRHDEFMNSRVRQNGNNGKKLSNM